MCECVWCVSVWLCVSVCVVCVSVSVRVCVWNYIGRESCDVSANTFIYISFVPTVSLQINDN